MTAPVSGQKLAIYDGQRCLGYVVVRGRADFEALDTDNIPVGHYQTQAAAVDALTTTWDAHL